MSRTRTSRLQKPAAPRVTATSGSGWSLEVTWNAPRNDGPPISSYQIRYRKTGDDSCYLAYSGPSMEAMSRAGAPRLRRYRTRRIIDVSTWSLVTQYEVQVRALNGEGDPNSFHVDPNDNWSKSGRGTTGCE